MSALSPKADIETQSHDVCFVPKADMGYALAQEAASSAAHRRGMFNSMRSPGSHLRRARIDTPHHFRFSVISIGGPLRMV
jgi:hypothetical protein